MFQIVLPNVLKAVSMYLLSPLIVYSFFRPTFILIVINNKNKMLTLCVLNKIIIQVDRNAELFSFYILSILVDIPTF